MNPKHLDIFSAVMSTGTTSGAAQLLHLTQPTVSKSIQSLERSIDIVLFKRTMGRILPTPRARMLHRLTEGTGDLTLFVEGAERVRSFTAGEFCVASAAPFDNTLIPAALRKWNLLHADRLIRLTAFASSEVRTKVARGETDVGIAWEDGADDQAVRSRPLVSLSAALAVPRAHPLAQRSVIAASEILQEDFVAISPSTLAWREGLRRIRQAGGQARVAVEADSGRTACAMVRIGMGCTVVDESTAIEQAHPALTFVPLDPPAVLRAVLILPSRMPIKPHVRDFIRLMLASGADSP